MQIVETALMPAILTGHGPSEEHLFCYGVFSAICERDLSGAPTPRGNQLTRYSPRAYLGEYIYKLDQLQRKIPMVAVNDRLPRELNRPLGQV